MAKKQEEKTIQNALEALNKSYGKGTVGFLDGTDENNEYDVISTGSFAFDYGVLGVGGVVKGRLYELMGWEGCGKSTVCGHIVANCQANGGVAAYLDGEHAVDKKYFQALGVDFSKLIFAQPTFGEEGFNIAKTLIESGIDLLIIDSDNALLPKSVVDGEIGDSAIGKKARLNSDAYPKLKPYIVKHGVCVIVVSQYREKIGVMFGNPTTTQGGHALKYYSDCRIEMTKSLAKDGTDVYGNITKVKTVKNKTYPPYKTGSFEIIYGKGIDATGELLGLLHEFGIGRKYGKTFTYRDVKYETVELIQLMQDNPELVETMQDDLLKVYIGDADLPLPTKEDVSEL